MCRQCGTLSDSIVGPFPKASDNGRSAGRSDVDRVKANGSTPDDKTENVFSDDENEKKFVSEICYIRGDHWIHSEMKWNTIHGVPWKRMNALGRGAFGAVFMGMREDKKLFAVKSIIVGYPLTPASKNCMKAQVCEIKMLRYLRSKYIVRCLGCGRSRGENGLNQLPTLDVFIEFAARGSLRDLCKAMVSASGGTGFPEEPYIRQYTYDLLKALQYLKKKKVVHGDLKMGNLLLTDNCVKLTDWGGAKQLSEKNLKQTLIGTRGFQAPEVLKHRQQGYPSDIFSLGCTLIEMATGKNPRAHVKADVSAGAKVTTVDPLHPPKERKEDIAKLTVKIPDSFSHECKDFLKLCVCPNPEDRWTAAELLHHPFITNRDKTNHLPYDLPIDTEVSNNLLQPPRQLDPELPDEPMTARVYQHLTGTSPSWAGNMGGCRPADPPQVISPAPKPSNIQPPHPLPPLHQGHSTKEEFPYNLLPWLVRKKKKFQSDSSTSMYRAPRSDVRILVPTPIGSPLVTRAGTLDSAIQKTDEGGSTELVDMIVTGQKSPALATEIEAKDSRDEMLNNAAAMREANNAIFEIAKMAPDKHARDLFPLLKEKEVHSQQVAQTPRRKHKEPKDPETS